MNGMRASQLQDALKTLGEAMQNVGAILEEMRAEHDPLASHIFLARRRFGKVLDSDTKSGKRSEREAYFSWKEACKIGFCGDLGEWRRLLGAMPRR
jgi:hypothetical protein